MTTGAAEFRYPTLDDDLGILPLPVIGILKLNALSELRCLLKVMVTKQEIDHAAALLRQGDLVAFPTETVYGLGANALDPIAVAKIFELKGRPRFDPLIVHISKPSDMVELVDDIPLMAQELVKQFWPGPLSLVLSKKSSVPDIVTAGLGKCGHTLPRSPCCPTASCRR